MNSLDVKLLVNRHIGDGFSSKSFVRAMLGFRYPPTHYSSQEPVRTEFGEASIEDFLSLWGSQGSDWFGQVLLRRRAAPRYSCAVNFLRGPKASFNSLSFYGFDPEVHKLPGTRSAFLGVVDQVFVDLRMSYGRICLKEDFDRKNIVKDFQHSDGSVEPRKPIGIDWTVSLPGVYWCNYFGEPFLSWFSLGSLMSCPAFTVEKISDTAVRILAYDDPAIAGNKEANEAEHSIREHLGMAAFFDRREGEIDYISPLRKFVLNGSIP